jgi:hypothetical protein
MQRLQEAQNRYSIARGARANTARECGSGSMPSADGNFALSKALQAENAALLEYQRVLTIFTDLTVNGKLPPE